MMHDRRDLAWLRRIAVQVSSKTASRRLAAGDSPGTVMSVPGAGVVDRGRRPCGAAGQTGFVGFGDVPEPRCGFRVADAGVRMVALASLR